MSVSYRLILSAGLLAVLGVIWGACGSEDPATPEEPTPVCTVRPDTVDFGPVTVGTSAERTIEIENTGTGTLSGNIAVSTAAPCDGFSIVSGGGSFSLAANQILSVRVRFEPATTGAKSCRLETGAALCGDIVLLGSAEVPTDCAVDPLNIDFGSVGVGTTRDTTFTITNTGGGFLSGSVDASCGPVTVVSGGGPYTLGAGQSRVVTIRFQPSEGANSCTVETGTALCSDVLVTGVTDFPSFVATVVGEAGTILRTSDGGETWVRQTSGTTRILGAVCFTDTSTGTAVGQNGTILRTTDGGATWAPQTSNTTSFMGDVFFTDASTGTTVGTFGVILHTSDGGATWTPQTSNTTENLNRVFFVDASTGWIIGWRGIVLKTTDGGANWVPQDPGTDRLLATLWFFDAATGMIGTTASTWSAFSTSQLLRTSNGGDSWSISAPAPDMTFNALWFLDANVGTAVGAGGEILRTSDGGASWAFQNSGLSQLNGVSLLDVNVGVAVGYNGKIIETFDGGGSWVERPSTTLAGLRDVWVVGY